VIELGEHKGDGIRYAMHLSAPKGGSAQMLRDPDGGWVSWEDYARLKAENKRLRKAGDGLVFALESMDIIMDMESDHPEVAVWIAAKKGKQS